METYFVSASPAEIPREEEETCDSAASQEFISGIAHSQVEPLDQLTKSQCLFDCNYYIPFKVNKRRCDTEFYENLKDLARKRWKQIRKLELRKLRRLAFLKYKQNINKCKQNINESNYPSFVSLDDKLEEVKMLFGELDQKEDGDGEENLPKEDGEENMQKEDGEGEENMQIEDGDREENLQKEDGEENMQIEDGEENMQIEDGDREENMQKEDGEEHMQKEYGEENMQKEDGEDNMQKKDVNKEVKTEDETKNKKKKKCNYEDKVEEIEEIEEGLKTENNEKNFDDDNHLLSGSSQSVKSWGDIKITSNKHPLDPSCYGNEVIRKIIQKKKPKRRLKVPFTCQSKLPQRLNQEMEQFLSQHSSSSTKKAAMVLHIGRNRPLYQEQWDNVSHFENSDCINANWAKFAASAVQTDLNRAKVSRLLIPVLCNKLVKLLEYNDELREFDNHHNYGIDRKVVVDGSRDELKNEEKELQENEVKKVKRKSISSVVKNVVAKLIDTVVAEEEHCDVDVVKIVQQKRVGRELKRLNASYIELEEELTSSPLVEEAEDANLAKIEKEYHQTVLKKKNEIIFVNNKNKRLRRRPLKLEDHVLEVGDNDEREEEKVVKFRRTNGSPCHEIKTDEIRRVEASVEDELSNPPVKDCSVKLVKALNLDNIEHTAADDGDTEKVQQTTEDKNDKIEETYVEDTCSLPKFVIKVPDKVASPPLFKAKRYSNDPTSPSIKKRRIEEIVEKKKPCKKLINGEVIKNMSIETILKSQKANDAKTESMPNRATFHSSPESLLRSRLTRVGVLNDEVSIHPSVTQKRIKTLKPVRRPEETVTRCEEPEMSVKILSVMSLNPEVTVMPNRREDILQEAGAAAGKAVVIPTQVRFLKVPINQQFEQFTHKDNELDIVFGKGKLSFALTILERNPNNEIVFIPAVKTIKHNEDKYFGVYFHHHSLSTAFVGPYQHDEDPQIYIKLKSDSEPVKYEGEFCVDGIFVLSFWKCHNRSFERRICKDPNVKQLAVYLYRRRNQENSASKSFLNISQEVSKPNDKRRRSLLNSIKNFHVKPLDDDTKNSAPACAVDSRCESPHLDIRNMEVDFVDSVSECNVVSGHETSNNNSLIDQQNLYNNGSETNVLIDKKTANNEPIINYNKTNVKQPKMKNGMIGSGQSTIDNLKSFFDYAKNLNKLALNNVELSYKQIEENTKTKKIEKTVCTVTNEKNAIEKLSENSEVEIICKKKLIVNDDAHNVNNDITRASNEPKLIDVVDLDLYNSEEENAVSKTDETLPITTPRVVDKDTASTVKKQPITYYRDLGIRKILPKPVAPDQGPQKMILRVDTSKSILNPAKVNSNPTKSASNPSNSAFNSFKMIPVSQIPSNLLAKSILKNHTDQKNVQILPKPKEGVHKKMFLQAKVGSKIVNVQLIPQTLSSLTDATHQLNNSHTPLKQPLPQGGVNLMKLVEEKLAQQKQSVFQQSTGGKKLTELTSKPVSEKTSEKMIQNNNIMANMFSLGGNKVVVTVPMGTQMVKFVSPKSVTVDKTANNFIQIQSQFMSQTNKKDIGIKNFIKIPPNAQNIKITPEEKSASTTPDKTVVRVNLPLSANVSSNASRSADPKPVSESPITNSSTNNLGNKKTSNSTMSTNLSLSGNIPQDTLKSAEMQASENATINKSSTVNLDNNKPVTDTSTSTAVGHKTSQNVDVIQSSRGTTKNREETSHLENVLNVSESSTDVDVMGSNDNNSTSVSSETSQNRVLNVSDESTAEKNCSRNGTSIEDPDALKIISNWKYNTKYMQSLGLFLDEEDF